MPSTPPLVRFLELGDWPEGRVRCRWVQSSFAPPPDLARLIDDAWSAEMRRPGIKLFDGPMCRLERYDASQIALELSISPISYKPFLGTNLRNSDLAAKHGRHCLANPLGISCALLSHDGYLLLGRRGNRVAYYPNRIHPFAGAVEPRANAPPSEGPPEVFADVRRELEEEVHVKPDELGPLRCLSIVEDVTLRQPELICWAPTRLGWRDVAARVDASEHDGIVAIELGEGHYNRAINETKLTPVATATCLLVGGMLLGPEWWQRTLAADRRFAMIGHGSIS